MPIKTPMRLNISQSPSKPFQLYYFERNSAEHFFSIVRQYLQMSSLIFVWWFLGVQSIQSALATLIGQICQQLLWGVALLCYGCNCDDYCMVWHNQARGNISLFKKIFIFVLFIIVFYELWIMFLAQFLIVDKLKWFDVIDIFHWILPLDHCFIVFNLIKFMPCQSCTFWFLL